MERRQPASDLTVTATEADNEGLTTNGGRQERVADSESPLRFLARASTLLAESLDYDTTLANVARLAVPYLADCCIVDMLEEDGRIRRLAVAHGEPEKEGLARELERHPPQPTSTHGVPNVLRTGQPELRSVVEDSLLPSLARDSEHLRILEELKPRSHVVVPLAARGKILGAMTFIGTDQSGRRYTEAELALASDLAYRASLAVDNARLYREAQDAVRVRNDFISIAAHELRTPMSGLRLAAQLALRRLEKSGEIEPAQVRSSMHTIDVQSEKLERLISQLLDISRIDSGRLVLEPEMVDIRKLADDVVASARARSQRPITIRGPRSLTAWADPLRLEQVLTNLIDNALKHTEATSAIRVQISAPTSESVRIAVRDRGPGIPEAYRSQIFERFFRVPGEHQATGMGIGLYVSRDIVRMHGGEIMAEFPPEGGAGFVVDLPRRLTDPTSP
jgi:signal transduction histidine kinase